MVTFTLGEREARMSLDSGLGDTAVLRWSQSLINRPEAVSNGEHAMNFLAEKWHCEPEEISNDLPNEITTPEQELDFVMFYRHHPMALRVKGEMPKPIWVDWISKSNSNDHQPYRSWIEPLWRDVLTRVEFEWNSAYQHEVLRRIKDGDDKTGLPISSEWKMVDSDGKTLIQIAMPGSYLTAFPVLEGEMREGLFRPHRLTGEVIKITIPNPSEASRVVKIVKEERIKAFKKTLEPLFPPDSDVVCIYDYPGSSVDQVFTEAKGYDIFWRHGTTVLFVRIPASGQVRCPDQFRGHLIGQKGVKIKTLAEKHGHRYLKVI
ncbi:MAG: hypothetical protein LiPW15_635 [Parcubacteria group bacterium LiPW_15]|nr:MAG: hypothetical protein LiPW15_635 [Parcubacteria group bacterium LiPW_15]